MNRCIFEATFAEVYTIWEQEHQTTGTGSRNHRQFIGAQSSDLVLTSGTTHGLNMLVQSVGETLSEGDVVILSAVEHHAHLLPWQRMSKRYGFSIEIVPIDQQGNIDLIALDKLLGEILCGSWGFR